MLLLDVFNAPPPVEKNKFETPVRCMRTKIPIKIEWAKKSWYTYSSLQVVEVIVLTRILDHLMLQIAISDGWMNEARTAGQHFEKNYIVLFSFPSLSKKQNHLAVAGVLAA